MSVRLIGGQGGGSAIIEALLTLGGITFEREMLDWDDIYSTSARLKALNPAGQIPALVLENGEIVTETAALTLLIDEWAPDAGLAPKPGAAERALFLRALAFVTASLYPMWTIDDQPARWVGGDEAAQAELRARTKARRAELWGVLDGMIKTEGENAPWALGARFSGLDVFICVMTRWRPRREWFAQNLPRLYGIATRVDALPALKPVWARNFN